MSDLLTTAPALPKSDQNLVWLDCEMTGLNPEHDRIIEIAERLRHAESHGFSEGEPIDEGGGEIAERSDFRRLQPPKRRRRPSV